MKKKIPPPCPEMVIRIWWPKRLDPHPTVHVDGKPPLTAQLQDDDRLAVTHDRMGTFWLTRFEPIDPDALRLAVEHHRPSVLRTALLTMLAEKGGIR